MAAAMPANNVLRCSVAQYGTSVEAKEELQIPA